MKANRLLVVPVVATMGAAFAVQQNPSMHFMALVATPGQGAVSRTIMQSRHDESMVVVVKEPAPCGERLAAPSFAVGGDTVHLGYQRPAAGTRNCEATGIFTLQGLPQGALKVAADARNAASLTNGQIAQRAPQLSVQFTGGEARSAEGAVQRAVRQVRHGDQLIAVVTQPAACGSRLIDPSAALDEHGLSLRYGVTEPSPGQAVCAATGVFSIKGLPERQLVAVADGRPVSAARTMPQEAMQLAVNEPKMSFIAVPAIAPIQGSSGRTSEQVRNGDTLNLVLHEPVACGERLQAASYKLQGSQLSVHYQVPAAQGAETKCMATAMIMFRGLPAQDIRVVAVSDTVAPGLALDKPQAKFD